MDANTREPDTNTHAHMKWLAALSVQSERKNRETIQIHIFNF